MEKIFGYEPSVVKTLIKETGGENKNLSKAFELVAGKTGLAKGTIRNTYYVIAKKSKVDSEFRDKFLDGKILSTRHKTVFGEIEEKKLIKEICRRVYEGRSVRSVTLSLADGDATVALRYQNKYRNVVKKNPQLICRINDEIKKEYGIEPIVRREVLPELQFRRLTDEIDRLVDRISEAVKAENVLLKARIRELEREVFSMRLKSNGNIEKTN